MNYSRVSKFFGNLYLVNFFTFVRESLYTIFICFEKDLWYNYNSSKNRNEVNTLQFFLKCLKCDISSITSRDHAH